MHFRRALACLLAAWAVPCLADLPADGWPQTRRDAAQTGQSPEPALADPVIVWTRAVGEALEGEIAASGCALHVANGGGEVLRVNARSGQREWRTPGTPSCGPVGIGNSSIALDTEAQVIAGLAGDPRLIQLYQALFEIHVACQSYAIDNNEWPPGGDLRATLWPTHIDPWPINPCTGADVIVTDTPSVGDIRYARPSQDVFYLGGWWTDGGLVPLSFLGIGSGGTGGLDPTWPVSVELGGGGRSHERTDGALRWRKSSRGIATVTEPRLIPGGVAWTEGEIPAWSIATGAGRMHVTDSAGATIWEAFRMEGYIGGAAVDAPAGRVFASASPAPYGWYFDQCARTLAMLVESYSIDYNEYPPSGDLAPSLVPRYVRTLVANPLTGATSTFSVSPSPGNYFYEALNGQSEYRVGMWSSDGTLVSIIETGTMIAPGPDDPGLVECRSLADGALIWTFPIENGESATPPMLTSEGVIVGGMGGLVRCLDRADGHEIWRVDAGRTLYLAPALLPDGGLVFVQAADGRVIVVDPPPLQRVRFDVPLGMAAYSAAAVTSDGVVLVGDWTGILHAIRADGSVMWTRDCGGGAGIPITTGVLPHEGWLYVGRADGAIVALAPADTGGVPPRVTGLLLARRSASSRDVAALSWPSAPLPAGVLGAHHHLKRSLGSPTGPWMNVLSPDGLVTMTWDDSTPGEALVFYTLTVADCGENEP